MAKVNHGGSTEHVFELLDEAVTIRCTRFVEFLQLAGEVERPLGVILR